MSKHLFTSESVSEGHPDKIADQISDAVLDAILEQDPKARVACETMATTNRVILGGEVRASEDKIAGIMKQIESAVQTPVQTFVKRADEQAFALRNGSNLMYVEDASRRILDAVTGYRSATVEVRHFESLHGHDAVAKSYWVAPTGGEKLSAEGAGL